VIPVEVTQAPWHYTTFPEALDHWQTGIAGVLAFVAGILTVVAAMRVISATREQTATTVRLERERILSEESAFRAVLEAAMARILAEATGARKTYLQFFTQPTGASPEAVAVRQCITKGAFAELREACVRRGGPLTGEFLDLEREIDSFASQSGDYLAVNPTMRKEMYVALVEQLALIETKATALRQKAAE
jgi:hypothetical protein